MGRVRAFIRILRPLNSIMVGVSVLIGLIITGNPTILSEKSILLFSFITGFTLSAAAMTLNDYFDVEIDSLNEPDRPIPSGEVKPIEAITLTVFLSILGLISAWKTSISCLGIAFFALVLMFLYSFKGKRTGVPGNLMVSTCIALPFIYGGVIVGKTDTALIFSVIAFLSNNGREIVKGIVDIEGDKTAGIKTLAVTNGASFAARIASIFYFSAVIISISPYSLGLVSFWYIPFVFITDIILLHGVYRIILNPSRENSRNNKNRVLYGMMLGLIGFALGNLL